MVIMIDIDNQAATFIEEPANQEGVGNAIEQWANQLPVKSGIVQFDMLGRDKKLNRAVVTVERVK